MICKKCKIEMKHMIGKQNGGYHICIECNNVLITGDTDNVKEDNQYNQTMEIGRIYNLSKTSNRYSWNGTRSNRNLFVGGIRRNIS